MPRILSELVGARAQLPQFSYAASVVGMARGLFVARSSKWSGQRAFEWIVVWVIRPMALHVEQVLSFLFFFAVPSSSVVGAGGAGTSSAKRPVGPAPSSSGPCPTLPASLRGRRRAGGTAARQSATCATSAAAPRPTTAGHTSTATARTTCFERRVGRGAP